MSTDDFSQYEGVFDDLTPEQLIQGPRASKTKTGTFVGPEAFARFVDESVAKTAKRYTRKAKRYPDAFAPVVVHCALATPATLLTYEAEHDDTVGLFLERLRTDAKLMRATWFFIAVKTVVGSRQVPEDAPEPDITSAGAMDDVVEDGVMGEGILWHAKRSENGDTQQRNGILTVVENTIVEQIEGSETQAIEVFAHILP